MISTEHLRNLPFLPEKSQPTETRCHHTDDCTQNRDSKYSAASQIFSPKKWYSSSPLQRSSSYVVVASWQWRAIGLVCWTDLGLYTDLVFIRRRVLLTIPPPPPSENKNQSKMKSKNKLHQGSRLIHRNVIRTPNKKHRSQQHLE
jgi:hypothetical protein